MRTWPVQATLTIFMDDIIQRVIGDRHAVAVPHPWVSRCLLQWLLTGLRKPVAEDKLRCIVSSKSLRTDICNNMRAMSIPVAVYGEMLGIDFTAGGPMRRRCVQEVRSATARKKRGRLKWLRRMGGLAKSVASGWLRRWLLTAWKLSA